MTDPFPKKSVAVVGMGSSGQSAAKLAFALGYNVLCIDRNPTNVPTGCYFRLEPDVAIRQDAFDLIIVSPGVPAHNAILQMGMEKNIPIISELNFASRRLKVPMVAVTGTNGKSSTVWYAQQMADQLGLKTFLGGNFGSALSEMVLDIVENGTHYDLAIVEVSSYQMEWSQDFHPATAAILNLTPDHLARHGTIEEYRRCKLKIFENLQTTERAIIPLKESELLPKNKTELRFFGHLKDRTNELGCFIDDQALHWIHAEEHWTLLRQFIPLMGEHNLYNIGAAMLLLEPVISKHVSVDFCTFLKPLEHRLESVWVNNREWINDSKATNIEATEAALKSMIIPVTLLLGGAGKQGADYTQLAALLQKKTHRIICFGASGSEIHAQLSTVLPENIRCTTTVDLSSAIQLARLENDPRPVLLSPACASFDAFNNFEHRGRYFKETLLPSEPV